MNKEDFNAILQVALWKNDGMGELEIRQHFANFGSSEVVEEGIKLYNDLNKLELKKGVDIKC